MAFLILFAFVLLITWWWLNYARIPDKFPKGPFGLPLIGYWPILSAENIVAGLETLHHQYGPNLSLNIGPGKRIVVIGDFETLKVIYLQPTRTCIVGCCKICQLNLEK
jgi:hypothetical protein